MNLSDMAQGLPKTELLYLRQMELTTTHANILKVVPEKATQAYHILDKTIFHPKGGGQPSDRGKMASAQFTLEIKKAIPNQGVVIHWAKITRGTPTTGPVSCVSYFFTREMRVLSDSPGSLKARTLSSSIAIASFYR